MPKEDWTDEELRAAVGAYLAMQKDAREGRPVVKRHVYEELSNTFGRSVKSFEFRMQNISFVLSSMGRSWIDGLKPAKHVGANVGEKIEKMIADLERAAAEK
ncbi:hypothetical protein [Noviluteimonas gilva]|nr:hypothetical protein [Lysobacter gilvus]